VTSMLASRSALATRLQAAMSTTAATRPLRFLYSPMAEAIELICTSCSHLGQVSKRNA